MVLCQTIKFQYFSCNEFLKEDADLNKSLAIRLVIIVWQSQYLCFDDVSLSLYSVVGGFASTWFDPLRVIDVGILCVDLLKNLPREVIHSLKSN